MLEDTARVPALSQVGPGLKIAEGVPRFRKIASHWRGFAAHGELTGEFGVPNFRRTIFEPALPLTWEGSPEEERQLFAEFREIDSHPVSGTGLFSVVRLQQVTNPLEIWLWDARVGALQLDVDYLGYLEALSLTKGTHGWQYLFTDVSMENPDPYHVADDMKTMLQVFPQHFPRHGYEDLERRLEERLQSVSPTAPNPSAPAQLSSPMAMGMTLVEDRSLAEPPRCVSGAGWSGVV
ncbi:hypothetical protein OG292_11110 [Streptomyces sp. NBC_01511]|uniref:hypothetical protein n=1 Tax=Streptomyces sp. NBC_01511 TaxID=2903889 RepID=UPI00386D6495